MRIGILTYSSAHNYGAMLQCYALQEFLKTLGHTVYVIDYRPDYFQYGLFVGWKWISFSPVKTWRKVRFQFHTFKCQRQRYLAFERFSKRYFHLKTLRLSYYQDDIDCFVLGSDQIWRKNRGKFDPVYWGDFEESKGHKFISYAASMGLDRLEAEDEMKIRKWMIRFSSIMVRETSLKDLLAFLTDKKIEVVSDPVFLLTARQWDDIATSSRSDKPYVLIYQVISHPSVYGIARQAAEHFGAEIIEIASQVTDGSTPVKTLYTASPEDFVGYVAHACFIVTTSFHGTAFSMIYNKPFVCIRLNKPSDVRVSSLLSQVGLSDRFVDSHQIPEGLDLYRAPVWSEKNVNLSKQLLADVLSV